MVGTILVHIVVGAVPTATVKAKPSPRRSLVPHLQQGLQASDREGEL